MLFETAVSFTDGCAFAMRAIALATNISDG